MAVLLAWLFATLAVGGIVCTIVPAAAVAVWSRRSARHGAAEPATVLKPLHGAEPRLAENLRTFLVQDWAAPIQMVCGVQRGDDPAIGILERHSGLVPEFPHGRAPKRADGWMPQQARHDEEAERDVTLVVDPTPHGGNAKVANLINMMPVARHDLLVLSDSDMAVPRDYLARIAGAMAEPGVGAVTCVYRGRGDAGPWSTFAAAGSSYHFLPSVLLGLTLRLARPCMGSTIALRRGTLDRIGGFESVSDRLADDYEIGRAVRALGLRVAIPPLLLIHASTETSFAALWRHERRWAATLRAIDPAANAGTVFTYPLPFALALVPLMPRFGGALLLIALASRLLLKVLIDRWAGASTCPAWMVPLRDCLSLAVFLSAFVARSVDWRGATLTMKSRGRIAAQPELPSR